jgi:D-lactate dehydrogenase
MSALDLADIEPFSSCRPETREALTASAERRQLQPGETLFEEGDDGTFMFAVESGRLTVRASTGAETSVVLRDMTAGEVGGLTTMTTEKKRSATVTAADESVVITIPKEVFVRSLETHGDLARAVIAFLAKRVRSKTRRLASLMSGPRDEGTPVAVFDAKSYDAQAFEALDADDLSFHCFEAKLDERTAALAAGHPVVCAFVNDDLSAPVVRALAENGVGLIAMRCAGYNNVDLSAAKEAGLDVVRVPAYSPHAVAEHAMALVLSLNRKIHRAYNRVREANFSLGGLVGFDLHGRTMGVVGMGKIGSCMAEIAKGFGMTVLAFDAYPDADLAERIGFEYVELEPLLARSDVVSLHAPLNPDTYHLIDADRIGGMKRGAMLINTSRGGLVDAAALIDALKSGQIGAAGLDVYEEESEYFFEDRSDRVITDDLLARLITFNNVLVTSHQAFLTHEALSNIATTTWDNIRAWLSGKRGADLPNAVPLRSS